MSFKKTTINIIAICAIVVIPHLELIPLFGYSLPILLLVWFALKQSNNNFKSIGFSFKLFNSKAILTGIIVAVLALAFMQLIFFPVLDTFISFKEVDVQLYAFLKENKWQFIFTLIMGWLIGGFYEEIVFHGFIFSRLEEMFKGKHATPISFIITTILFGVYHIQLGVDGLINAFIVGAIYQALFLYFKRNLWYSILCHGFYNSIVMIMIYLNYL